MPRYAYDAEISELFEDKPENEINSKN